MFLKIPPPQIKSNATRDKAICHTYVIYFLKYFQVLKKIH